MPVYRKIRKKSILYKIFWHFVVFHGGVMLLFYGKSASLRWLHRLCGARQLDSLRMRAHRAGGWAGCICQKACVCGSFCLDDLWADRHVWQQYRQAGGPHPEGAVQPDTHREIQEKGRVPVSAGEISAGTCHLQGACGVYTFEGQCGEGAAVLQYGVDLRHGFCVQAGCGSVLWGVSAAPGQTDKVRLYPCEQKGAHRLCLRGF